MSQQWLGGPASPEGEGRGGGRGGGEGRRGRERRGRGEEGARRNTESAEH